MSILNKNFENINHHSCGFYPQLFQIEYNFQGIGDIPKFLKKLTNGITIIENTENKIIIKLHIDTTSEEFKHIFSFLINSKTNTTSILR